MFRNCSYQVIFAIFIELKAQTDQIAFDTLEFNQSVFVQNQGFGKKQGLRKRLAGIELFAVLFKQNSGLSPVLVN